MKALITGASGAVGTGLLKVLKGAGIKTAVWNRKKVPIDDYWAMEAFIKKTKPDVLFHLATASQPTGRDNESWLVNYEWTSELAWITRQLGIRFVFTSSVMVFSDDAPGPFTLESVPDAREGYGYEKYQAEQRALYQNPDAIIARLGWQIGDSAGSNNMVDNLTRQMDEQGVIHASRKWLPACSFINDTATALMALSELEGGVYLVNANTSWTFYDIVSALNVLHGNHWHVEPNDDFVYDQRMIDTRVPIPPLDHRLPALPFHL
ncbi:MAG: sugar nucleotide-binding protein [Aggregatilineales bacterium]